ncbi:MAG: indole-3-glycerol phosphate synthase TrpC [Candidatus Caenarcaniphilales bacterium]|nr:indole-3-glycerol phosphate synthase TrpC [Candidatus Caenarcaniphilales bacterium]
MSNILTKIIESKKEELEQQKSLISLLELKKLVEADEESFERRRSNKELFFTSLKDRSRTSIIAEIKRHSPSKGVLRKDLDSIELARDYERAGACAISVLTEQSFFHGSKDDLIAVRKQTTIPLLRKDFMLEEYQILEAALWGADIVLLIASVLSSDQIIRMKKFADDLNLISLIEVHTMRELELILPAKPELIGVNNRNLNDFSVRFDTSSELIKRYRDEIPFWLSESGIESAGQISRLRQIGFQGFLIGETMLKAQSPGAKLKELIDES